MNIVELLIKLLSERNELNNNKLQLVKELYEKAEEIATDYLKVLKQYEIDSRSDSCINSDDIVSGMELKRERYHSFRCYTKRVIQLNFFETDKNYRALYEGICEILSGDNSENLLDEVGKDYAIRGHTLLDIIENYQMIKIQFDYDEKLIKKEINRMIGIQYKAVLHGIDKMSEAYAQIINESVLKK